jgi:hypothetical protein
MVAPEFQLFKSMLTNETIACIGEVVAIEDERIVPAIVTRRMARNLTPPQLTYITVDSLVYTYNAVAGQKMTAHEVFDLYVRASSEECCRLPFGMFIKSYIARLIEIYIRDEIVEMHRLGGITLLKGLFRRGLENPSLDMLLLELLDEEAKHRHLNAAAKCIQNNFRRAICNPYTPLCKSRLMHEWRELLSEMA